MFDMREKELVLNGSPCDINLYKDGPRTVAEARKVGRLSCPNLEKCQKGELDAKKGYGCIMMRGLQVAQNALKEKHNIDTEMQDFGRFLESYRPPKGFIYSSDRKIFRLITERHEASVKIREFAMTIIGVPDVIGGDFNDVVAYAMTPDGIDLRKMEELEGRFGTNGGRGCDVRSGPCSCGAWH
ncbi:MAG: hypothetical protein ABH889_02050 [Candidatus Portnoybacteria bacterium]